MFFCLAFATLFLAMTGMRYLALRLGWAGSLPGTAADAARWALSFALFAGMLLGLAYAARHRVFAPAAVLCVSVLALALTAGVLWRLGAVEPATPVVLPDGPGGPGLILGTPGLPYGTSVVLLRGPGDPSRSRVLAVPGSPLVFQEEFGGEGLRRVSFAAPVPWFLQSVSMDLRMNAENLRRQFAMGRHAFFLYAGALVFMLGSLLFVLRFGEWPLANFFLGVLAFRGVLALDSFLNSNEVRDAMAGFLGYRMPDAFTVPAVFLAAGVLIHLCSLLAHLTRRQVGRGAA